MIRIARRAFRALRLGYLTGRAALHVVTTPYEIGAYCPACNSALERALRVGQYPDGPTRIGIVIKVGNPGRPCPVHVAWRELLKAGA